MPILNLPDRSTLSRGPALLILTMFGTVTKFISAGDVTRDFGITTSKQESAIGTLASFKAGQKPTVNFTPIGAVGYLPFINQFATLPAGRSLCGKKINNAWVDNTLIVQPFDTEQDQTTLYGAAPTGLPGLFFGADNGLFDGNFEFTIAGKNGVMRDAVNRFFLKEANAGAANGYDPNELIRSVYACNHSLLLPDGNGGAKKYFGAAKGAKVALGFQTADHADNGDVWDVSFSDVSPVVTLQPSGVGEDEILAALRVQGPGSEIGRNLAEGGVNLTIESADVFFRLPLAGIQKASLIHGATADLAGDLEFVGGVDVGAGGVFGPKFYVGAEPEA